MRLKGFFATTLLAVTVAGSALAQGPATQTVYEGSIGKAPVVIEIVKQGNLTTAQYFYSRYHLNIPLQASGPLSFEERTNCWEDTCPLVGKLQLKATATGLGGQWLGQAGKKINRDIVLKKVAERRFTPAERVADATTLRSTLSYDSPVSALDNPYLSRLYDSGLTEGKETTLGGYALRSVTDKATGVPGVRLTRAPDAKTLPLANRLLDGLRFQMVDGALSCMAESKDSSPAAGTPGGFEDTTTTVTYLSATLMTVEQSGSTYCGGAHPNNFWNRTTYDLKSGQALDPDQVLKLYARPAKTDTDGAPVETPEYQALKAKLTPKSPWFVGDKDQGECLSDDFGYGYSLSFSDKGLVFSLTDLPHVMGVCMGEYYVVPYSALKALWRPEAKTYFNGL